ncbi:hypothetical protein [Streptomyces sp. NPDC056323]|uniref:hypothetical protein n=1 Tax=Streptomyces sp. NPDC056323 TaxID=3345784 RepID=UPI0035DF5625
MRIASPSAAAVSIATCVADGNSNSCTEDKVSFTATECRAPHPGEERNQGDFHHGKPKINNYNP